MSKLNLICVFVTMILTQVTFSQKMTPEEIVQENLDFYNNRDIKGFMSSFSEDIKMYALGNEIPTVVGLQKVEELYRALFKKSPKLHSTIIKRIVFGNKVIDHESIVGRNGDKDVLELVLIYEVENQKINKITVIRK